MATQTVQISLTRTNDGRGGYTLNILSSDATGDCELVDVDFKNRHPIIKLGQNDFHLQPLFNRGGDAWPPCRICVNASETGIVPELQLVWLQQDMDSDPLGTISGMEGSFRLRLGSGGTWSAWRSVSIANMIVSLSDIGASSAVYGLTGSVFGGTWGLMAGVVVDPSESTDDIELEVSGITSTHTEGVIQLQSGAGVAKDEFQLIGSDGAGLNNDQVVNGFTMTVSWNSGTSSPIGSGDTAASAQSALESIVGAGDIIVVKKINNLMCIQFTGDQGNTNTSQAETEHTDSTIANGGPVS